MRGTIGRAAFVCAVVGMPNAPATAQDHRSKNLTLIVPFPAGGGTDQFARAIGAQLGIHFARHVVVENRTGASGNIGAEAVVRAPADGNTLLYTASTLALSRAVYSKLSFDAARDLAPITMSASIPQILAVHPSLPARSVRELVAISKRPDAMLAFSSGGAGSAGHFAMELLRLRTGAPILHVPYRGAAPAMTALVGGEVGLSFLVPPVVQAHLKTGRLRAIGISTRKRSSTLPDVATLSEQGVDEFEALQWHGVFAPAKTPPKVLEDLQSAILGALQSPEVRKHLAAEGAEVVGSSPAQFSAFFRAEIEKWADVARRARLQIH